MEVYEMRWAFEGLCSNIIKPKADLIIKATIRELQKIHRNSHMMLSPEDSPLDSIWDEICFQMQTEESVFWKSYESYVESCLYTIVRKKCTVEEIIMLWMQSEEYEFAADEFDDKEKAEFKIDYIRAFFYKQYSIDGAVHYLKTRLWEVASDYSNKRIEKAIFDGYDFD